MATQELGVPVDAYNSELQIVGDRVYRKRLLEEQFDSVDSSYGREEDEEKRKKVVVEDEDDDFL